MNKKNKKMDFEKLRPTKYLNYMKKQVEDFKNMIIQETDIIASLHLECKTNPGYFPDPEKDADKISLITTTFHTVQNGAITCIHESIIKYDAIQMEEKDMIITWINLIKKMNTKVIMGWYIFGLDYIFLEKKAIKFGLEQFFVDQLGEMIHKTNILKDHKNYCVPSEIKKFDMMRYIETVLHIIGPLHHALKELDIKNPILSQDNVEQYTLDCSKIYVELFYKTNVIGYLKEEYEKTNKKLIKFSNI